MPLIDLAGAFEPGPRQAQAVEAIRGACEQIGFLVITGHGIGGDLIQDIRDVSRCFFALPEAKKMACSNPPGTYRGFIPAQTSALALSRDQPTPPDLVEMYTINRFDDIAAARRAGLRPGRENFFAPNVWPDAGDADYSRRFRQVYEAYYTAMEGLAARIMRLMALGLNLDEIWFDGKIADHITSLSVLHYPRLERPALPGQFRRGPHSDWGSVTILWHDGMPGLQVLSPAGDWVDVPVVPDSFVVNLGDLMARWTNDRWVSTLHRVVAPGTDTGDRTSIAFFHQPAYDAVIECIPTCKSPDDPPRYEPVTSGGWIELMLAKSFD